MKKIKLYIAASIDGFIARPDGDLEWLTEYPNPGKDDFGYADFYNSIDTVIMGGRTYQSIKAMDVKWPYADKSTFVISRSLQANDNVGVITNDVIDAVSSLKAETGKDIWLVGGGEIVSMFLGHALIDEMIIIYVPIFLGGGVPLFPGINKESLWETSNVTRHDNGMIQVTYKRQ